MAFSVLRMAAAPSSTLSKPSAANVTPRRSRAFQVRCKAASEHETPKTISLSRRDAMLSLTALSAAGIGMSSPGTAEARISKAEMKRKIIEKLQELREKAGLSKKGESDKGKSPSSKKENKLPLEAAPFPLPSPPQSAPKPLVEATFL